MTDEITVYDKAKLADIDLNKVRQLAEYGHTDDFMADFFNVSPSVWQYWKKANPTFFKKLKGWKNTADDRVERALFERAMGYEWEEEGVVFDRLLRKPVKVVIEKRLPPDVNACIFWLKNRRREQWREKVEVETKHSGAIQHDVKTDKFELDERIKMLAEHAAEQRVEQIDFGRVLANALC
jgi:hypothetical protein